jgi:hypothetical protein
MGLVNTPRHFLLLAGMAAVLSVTGGWTQALGPVASCGVYGALHGAALAVALRSAPPPWQRSVFVLGASVLSMLSVSLALLVGRLEGGLHSASRPALLLAICAGAGAVSYSLLIRANFRATLSSTGIFSIALGCVVADLAVLWSGLYRHGGVFWFAVAWWFAMSLGLITQDARTKTRVA